MKAKTDQYDFITFSLSYTMSTSFIGHFLSGTPRRWNSANISYIYRSLRYLRINVYSPNVYFIITRCILYSLLTNLGQGCLLIGVLCSLFVILEHSGDSAGLFLRLSVLLYYSLDLDFYYLLSLSKYFLLFIVNMSVYLNESSA